MTTLVTLDQVLTLAHRLSPVDKVRLIEHIAPQIEQELQASQNGPRKSLRGLWQGLDTTEEEINEMRQELWDDFPRKDI